MSSGMAYDTHCPSVALGLQLGLWPSRAVSVWGRHACKPPKPQPQSKRGCRRLLTPAVTKHGTRVTFRLGPREAKELGEYCAHEGVSMSEALREALLEWYGIGELDERRVSA